MNKTKYLYKLYKITKLTQIKLLPLKTKVLLTNKTRTKDNNKIIKTQNAEIKSDLKQHRVCNVKKLIWLTKNPLQLTYLEKFNQNLNPFQKYGL